MKKAELTDEKLLKLQHLLTTGTNLSRSLKIIFKNPTQVRGAIELLRIHYDRHSYRSLAHAITEDVGLKHWHKN